MATLPPLREVEPLPPDPPGVHAELRGAPMEPSGEDGGNRLTRTTKIITTKLTILNPSKITRDSIVNIINETINKSNSSFYLLDQGEAYTPAIGALKDDESLPSYYKYASTKHRTVGILRIGIPIEQTFPQWKRSCTGLIAHLQAKQIYWEETTLESTAIRAPLFLYGIPTTGINLSDLHQMLKIQCNILNPFSLRVTTIKENDIAATCILVECDRANVKHVTESIFHGLLNSPMKNRAFTNHPISRAKPMTLAAGVPFFPSATTDSRVLALSEQEALQKRLVKIAYSNNSNIDIPFLFEGNANSTLRKLIYSLTISEVKNIVHGIIQTQPGRVLITIDRTHKSEILQKLTQLFKQVDPTIQAQGRSASTTNPNNTETRQHHSNRETRSSRTWPTRPNLQHAYSPTTDFDHTKNEIDTAPSQNGPTDIRINPPPYEVYCMNAIEEQRKVFITMLEAQERKYMAHIELLKDQIKHFTESTQRSTEQMGRLILDALQNIARKDNSTGNKVLQALTSPTHKRQVLNKTQQTMDKFIFPFDQSDLPDQPTEPPDLTQIE